MAKTDMYSTEDIIIFYINFNKVELMKMVGLLVSLGRFAKAD